MCLFAHYLINLVANCGKIGEINMIPPNKTSSGDVKLNDKQFTEAMQIIVTALIERGYDPYSQLYGYLKENDPVYITSHNGARDLIQELNKEEISRYIKTLPH